MSDGLTETEQLAKALFEVLDEHFYWIAEQADDTHLVESDPDNWKRLAEWIDEARARVHQGGAQ